jgi:hypothetical protein
MKLEVKAFALAGALLWGLGVFFITLWVVLLDGPSSDPSLLGRVYRGHTYTFVGACIGLLWGLVDGFLGGAILAWLYNRFSKGTTD